jgi:hypothetical protein
MELDTTLGALQGDITAIDGHTANSTLDYWQQTLENSGSPEYRQLAGDLAELKGHLASGDLKGDTIGALLRRIGEQTSAIAANAPADVAGKLQQLSQALIGASGSVSK